MSLNLPARTNAQSTAIDERVFGWDPTPGIVSVWANREGRAVVWRRELSEPGEPGRVLCTSEQFRPWLFAVSLDDLSHLGSALRPATAPGSANAPVSYQE